MRRPSREELFARLREVYALDNDEDLAHALGVKLRTFSDWKLGKSGGPGYEMTLRLLEEAGWLIQPGSDGDGQPIPPGVQEALVRMDKELARLRDVLARQSSAPARPNGRSKRSR
jgi:hypothetical protein